jgi:hypothetical protein
MELNGQLHAPVALSQGKQHPVPIGRGPERRVGRYEEQKHLTRPGNRTLAVKPVARRYTDWAITALHHARFEIQGTVFLLVRCTIMAASLQLKKYHNYSILYEIRIITKYGYILDTVSGSVKAVRHVTPNILATADNCICIFVTLFWLLNDRNSLPCCTAAWDNNALRRHIICHYYNSNSMK